MLLHELWKYYSTPKHIQYAGGDNKIICESTYCNIYVAACILAAAQVLYAKVSRLKFLEHQMLLEGWSPALLFIHHSEVGKNIRGLFRK